METQITTRHLSLPTVNALRRAGIYSMEHLSQIGDPNIRGIGGTRLLEIRAAVRQFEEMSESSDRTCADAMDRAWGKVYPVSKCKNNHPQTKENTYMCRGKLQCRVCKSEAGKLAWKRIYAEHSGIPITHKSVLPTHSSLFDPSIPDHITHMMMFNINQIDNMYGVQSPTLSKVPDTPDSYPEFEVPQETWTHPNGIPVAVVPVAVSKRKKFLGIF